MFIGHFAVGFAAKRVAPKVSLGALFLSVQLVDLLWPACLLLGLEHVRIVPGITAVTPLDFYDYPITHSMMGVVGWSILLGAVHLRLRGERRGALVLGVGALSHWFLDALVHRPDLLLAPGGGTRIGLGLWDSPAGTMLVEGGLFIAGCTVYLRSTMSLDRTGRYATWGLMAFLVVAYVANLLGPPPPGVAPIALAGLAGGAVLVPWAWWADRHRCIRGSREV